MQVIILAGGEGTRLRPITCARPKPLAEICGKPVLEHIFDLLIRNGFREATVTLMYQAEKIMERYGESFSQMRLSYCVEESPLGTAGCVRKAWNGDEVLVISGDAVCDFDLRSAYNYHKTKNADVTIVTKSVSDPREYGLVLAEESGRIKGFIEKPSYESCITDSANTGVYFLSVPALNEITIGRQEDFAKDLFPKLMRKGKKLYSYNECGYWCDIGDIESYLRCNKDVLNGRANLILDGFKTLSGSYISSGLKCIENAVNGKAFIGKNVVLGDGVLIGGECVIGDNVIIGNGARITDCVIMNKSVIGDKADINGCVVCGGVRIGQETNIKKSAVIGDNSVIGRNCCVERGVRIWNGIEIEDSTSVSYDVKSGKASSSFLDEAGRLNFEGSCYSIFAAKVGTAVGSSIERNSSVVIGCEGGGFSKSVSSAVASGLSESGVKVFSITDTCLPELIYCCDVTNADAVIFVGGNPDEGIYVRDRGGLCVTRTAERKIESALNRGERRSVNIMDFGELEYADDLKEKYKDYLKNLIDENCRDSFENITIKCDSHVIAEILKSLPGELYKEKNSDTVILANDGCSASAKLNDKTEVSYEQLAMIVCKYNAEKGVQSSVPYSFPSAFDKDITVNHLIPVRYFNTSCGSDVEARKLAQKISNRYVTDGLTLACMIVRILAERKETLSNLLKEIPSFSCITKKINLTAPVTETLKRFAKSSNCDLGEGVKYYYDGSRALIRPLKSGKGLCLFAESFKAEAASALCDKLESIISGQPSAIDNEDKMV